MAWCKYRKIKVTGKDCESCPYTPPTNIEACREYNLREAREWFIKQIYSNGEKLFDAAMGKHNRIMCKYVKSEIERKKKAGKK